MPTRPDTNALSIGLAITFRGISMLRTAAARFALCCDRYRQRRDLAELDPRQLDDIGVTREEARHESCLPFWHGGAPP